MRLNKEKWLGQNAEIKWLNGTLLVLVKRLIG